MAASLPVLFARLLLSMHVLLILLLGACIGAPVQAAEELSGVARALTGSGPQAESPEEARIETTPSPGRDSDIQARIAGILSEIDGLDAVGISVTQGVVTLSGDTANEKKAQQALSLAGRLTDVVTVNDDINRTLDVQDNVSTVFQELMAQARGLIKALPLLLVGLVLFALVTAFGVWLSRRQRLWQRLAPNPFVAALLSQTIRVIFVVFGLILALSLMGAETILGTLLGGAGVIGLAVGFAVKDTIENYIASLMLSVRQPFRARDQVVINGQEGIVVRLTSRATILMTLDGNQLRIPNADVFKGTILNYTSNPERRFTFELGVDADDDPLAAIKVGLDAVHQLGFVLSEPRAMGLITQVGDSNIVLEFQVWVDQSSTDFGKARSIAIRETKHALEEAGFSLPEPIYRLRFNNSLEQALERFQGSSSDSARDDDTPAPASSRSSTAPPTNDGSDRHPARSRAQQILRDPSAEALFDARPDEKLMKKVEQEIARTADQTDLLNQRAPQE
ncbi:mechanosensitive ion channel [Kushneria sp. AK178]